MNGGRDPGGRLVARVGRALLVAAAIACALVVATWGRVAPAGVAAALPVVVLLYGLLFALGDEAVGGAVRRWVAGRLGAASLLPAALLLLLYGYGLAGGGAPLGGGGLLLPTLLLWPALFALGRPATAEIDTLDLAALLLFIAPLPSLRLAADTELPWGGGGFDSATRVVMLTLALYGFGVLRGLSGVGVAVRPTWRHLATTLWVWLAFLALCLVVGLATGFVTYVGHPAPTWAGVQHGCQKSLRILLHTALFEELLFRGLLQNGVAQVVHRAGRWRPAWGWGLLLLAGGAAIGGHTLTGGYRWLPAAMVVLLFAAAHRLERRGGAPLGDYTALAITGSAFGLVHLHAGSIVFVSLAIVAGWAYGYLYLRSRQLLYPVLVHTLINSSPMLLGVALVK